MIDWESESWGGHVHESETGSWLLDRHGEEANNG